MKEYPYYAEFPYPVFEKYLIVFMEFIFEDVILS